jgi:hypothetical protein
MSHIVWPRRALEALAERVVQRLVGQDGRGSLEDWGRYVGRAHRGRTVYVHREPASQAGAGRDQPGNLLKRLAAAELAAQDIRGLTVSRPR